ncbi:hypothetical protein [Yinghuangia sp. YIM S10712]|uniref:hypothetical protein n=1 Tax=Yinghuangia sp. YIM S10712 TaxID=3436930 RepID=UPI003F53C973
MRRGVTRFAAWLAVTATAVALSWYGVRTVLRGTVFEPPRAPALAADAVHGPAPDPASLPPASDVTISATSQPPTGPSSSPPPASPSARPTSAVPSSAGPSPSGPPPTTSPVVDPSAGGTAQTRSEPVFRIDAADGQAGSTRTYQLKGGRAVFTFTADAATLVAATPGSGWAVKVREGHRWLRVDFTRGGRTSSVFVTWNGHPPLAATYES